MSVVTTSGNTTFGTVDFENGTFPNTTTATEGASVYTATIAKNTGGTATKTITVNATEGTPLGIATANAVDLTCNATPLQVTLVAI